MDCGRLGKKLCDIILSAYLVQFSSTSLLFLSLNDIGIVIVAAGIIGNLVMRLTALASASLEFVFDWIRWRETLQRLKLKGNLRDQKYQLFNFSIHRADSLLIPDPPLAFGTYLCKYLTGILRTTQQWSDLILQSIYSTITRFFAITLTALLIADCSQDYTNDIGRLSTQPISPASLQPELSIVLSSSSSITGYLSLLTSQSLV